MHAADEVEEIAQQLNNVMAGRSQATCLVAIAEILADCERAQEEPDIDRLLSLVSELTRLCFKEKSSGSLH